MELELFDLTENGLRVTGTWNTKSGINISIPPAAPEVQEPSTNELDLRNKTFIVITALVSDLRRSELSNAIFKCVSEKINFILNYDE